MTGEKIELEGLAKLLERCHKLREELHTELKVTNYEAAKVVAGAARSRAPIGTSQYDEHPGALLLSIKARAAKSYAYVVAGSAAVPYAAPIHWGWPSRHIRPNPFLYHALDERVGEVVALYAKRVEAMEREAFP